MTNPIPKISVILCAYNGEDKVTRSIQSILSQTFKDFELIVIDDGSTDKTCDMIGNIQKNDARIILESIPHGGLAKALNAGLARARGQYIARMDVDDVALSQRFQKQIRFLEQDQAVGVLGTGYEIMLPTGITRKPKVPLLIQDSDLKRALPKFNPFFHGSAMIRKALLDQVGGYDEKFLLTQDYDLWFRLSKLTKFSNLNEVLMIRYEDLKTTQKEARQNWYALQVRLKAIREGNSSILNIIYMVRPLLVVITPIWLKQFIRKLIYGKN